MLHKAVNTEIKDSVNQFVKGEINQQESNDPLLEKEKHLNEGGSVVPGRPEVDESRIPLKVKAEEIPKEIIPYMIKRADYECLHPYVYKEYKSYLRGAILEKNKLCFNYLKKLHPTLVQQVNAYRKEQQKMVRQKIAQLGVDSGGLQDIVHGFRNEPSRGTVSQGLTENE